MRIGGKTPHNIKDEGGFLSEASTLKLLTPAVARDPETAHVTAPGASGWGAEGRVASPTASVFL